MRLWQSEFPFAADAVHYLDSAATTQKPQAVLRALMQTYAYTAPVHRSLYARADQLAYAVDQVRIKFAQHFSIAVDELLFTRGATDGFNQLISSWAAHILQPGDAIVLSQLEHHANLLPWLELAKRCQVEVRWLRLTPQGALDLSNVHELITQRTKFISLTLSSNVLGDLRVCSRGGGDDPLAAVVHRAKQVDARVVVDACQAAPFEKLNFAALGIDAAVVSAHKMLGPWSLGVVYVAHHRHKEWHPTLVGGGTVQLVKYVDDKVVREYYPFPAGYEAGSVPAAEIIAWGAALDFLQQAGGMQQLADHCWALTDSLYCELSNLCGIRLWSPAPRADLPAHLVTFTVEGVHAHDVAAYLDMHNIAVRAGAHCAFLAHQALGISATVRASVYGYTTQADIDALIQALKKLVHTL
jgi:cysteine desulfurase/selenocysteine lyase